MYQEEENPIYMEVEEEFSMSNKKRYIDLMERTLEAYSYEHIEAYFKAVKEKGLSEHGFPRLTANIGILIAHGRKQELLPIFLQMMDFCCENIPRVKAANDFSVKEIIFCIMALEDWNSENPENISAEHIRYWKQQLQTIVPHSCYTHYALTPQDQVYNWALFTGVSEYMRTITGLGDTKDFIDLQLASQLQWMDENGMYRDQPNEPMVYDLVSRGLFSILLHFGYRGKYYNEIDRYLRKAGVLTLKMQSVTGEAPFGGRSNQFLHNEAHLSVVCEFEACRYAKEGNYELAGQFKAAVSKALENIEGWLSCRPVSHIKNRFSIDSKYGCEWYAYFDKYMITTASFLYAAYLICDDTIPKTVPVWEAPHTLCTSDDFHKIFMNAGGYFLEFDTRADMHYDASGLGRVHKNGAPSAICLSVPCCANPNYELNLEETVNISLCPGYIQNGETFFAADTGSCYKLIGLSHSDTMASVAFQVTLPNEQNISANYTVDVFGVQINVSGEGEVVHMLPAFVYDGEVTSKIKADTNHLTVTYKGYCCKYTTDGEIVDSGKMGGNRNGHYRMHYAKAVTTLSVTIEIFKEMRSET